jgi:hypothetical protein
MPYQHICGIIGNGNTGCSKELYKGIPNVTV